MLGIDFSPVAKDGSCYILTISDYFTKWVEVVPTCTVNKMASTVTEASSLFKVSKNYLFVQVDICICSCGLIRSFSLIIFVV